jgi:outer membrane protein assembly factor BamA
MDLFRPFMTGTAEVGLQYITVEAYTSEGPHVQLGLKSPIWGRLIQGSVMWHLEELWFRHLSPAISPTLARELSLDHAQRNGYFEQTLVVDFRDDQVEPRLGAYGELRVHEGTIAAGGAFNYLRAIPEVRGYVPLGPVVFGTRARFGAFWGDVPVTERFFAGGANSQRGFGERRLSPFVDTVLNGTLVHIPYGGAAMIELSEEARFPLGSLFGLELGGVAFLDGGDDTETVSQLDVANLHWAAGPGLRVKTLIGAIRLDVAYRLNRYGPGEPDPNSRLAFHLSIGEAF